jgi:hypothetical protein
VLGHLDQEALDLRQCVGEGADVHRSARGAKQPFDGLAGPLALEPVLRD